MSTITPSPPFSFNYLQTYNTPTISVAFPVSELPFHGSIQNMELIGVPSWLSYQNMYYDEVNTSISFILKVIESYAYTLDEGNYLGSFQIKFRAPVAASLATFTFGPYDVTLNVQHTLSLNIIPNQFPFSYILGSNSPATQTLQIQSSSNWNITANQSWVTISNSSGFNSGQVSIGVDPTSLVTGTYSAILTVTDAIATQQAVVTLLVSQPSTNTTFLYINPGTLEFLSELGVENTTLKQLDIEASHSWSVVSSESWLIVSASTGVSGNTSINVSVDSVALTSTNQSYLGELTFTSQDIQHTVYVLLNIVEFFLQGIISNGFYYIEDRNYLEATNIVPNNFLSLEAFSAYNGSNNIIKTKTPYHLAVAKALVGMEGNNILSSLIPTADFTTRIKNDFLPLIVNYNAYNINSITDASTFLSSFQNVRFIKGKTPLIANKLTYMPTEITVTATAILSLSVFATIAPTIITVTGDYTVTYNTSINNDLYIYNAIIDLGAMQLIPGNQITINYAGIDTVVNISENAQERNIIAFETEWGTYDFIETTGELIINRPARRTETQIQLEGRKHTKIVEIDVGVDYVINTGWLYSQPEVNWFLKIMNSKRVFIYINNEPIEIILQTRSLPQYRTREYLKQFQLKFKKAIV